MQIIKCVKCGHVVEISDDPQALTWGLDLLKSVGFKESKDGWTCPDCVREDHVPKVNIRRL